MTTANTARKTAAFALEQAPSPRSHIESTVIRKSPGAATKATLGRTAMGIIRADMPIMTAILNMQLP